MTRFPDIPMFQGIHAPSRIEVDLHDLEVDGEIPADLNGAFYRIAPDHQFPPRFLDDVPFNADGTISMFRFENGRVHLKHRYVQTERFKAERAAGRALYGSSRCARTARPSRSIRSRSKPGSIVLEGRDGIVNFYRDMFRTVRESLTLHHLIADDSGLAADITTQFTAIEDAPSFVVAPLKKGELIRGRVFVYYTLRDGKIAHIRVARAGEMGRPQRA